VSQQKKRGGDPENFQKLCPSGQDGKKKGAESTGGGKRGKKKKEGSRKNAEKRRAKQKKEKKEGPRLLQKESFVHSCIREGEKSKQTKCKEGRGRGKGLKKNAPFDNVP